MFQLENCYYIKFMSHLKEFTKQQSALSKLPTKEDIANFCYFLASDKARYITGQSFNIDSGVMPT